MNITLGLLLGSVGVLVAALAIDLLFGELPARLHPVVWMGTLIRRVEHWMPSRGAARQFLAGLLLALGLPVACGAVALVALRGLEPWPVLHFGASVAILTSTFAARALGEAARQVQKALNASEIGAARQALRSLCSRDPSQLSEPELVAASVESVAENASDSWVAPLFFYVLLGVPGAVAYRAVNTLDAMLGYHGRYEYLGKASARLDDVLNFVPARLTALLLLLGGIFERADVLRGAAIWRRDARNTESPNAGRPMAAMAGLLGVRLEKAGHYGLGDAVQPLTSAQIERAWRIVLWAGALALLLATATLFLREQTG